MPVYRIEAGGLLKLAPERFGSAHSEARLEDLLAESGDELGVCWIARQARTTHGKIADLIGVAADGAVEVWELKRGRAPRDIVAQALEYAAWVSRLDGEALAQLSARFDAARPLDDRLQLAFGSDGDDAWTPPTLNQRQRVVLVAEDFEAETLEVCRWLAGEGVAIYCWRFGYHTGRDGEELLVVDRLTWEARGDPSVPGDRPQARRGRRKRAELEAAAELLGVRAADMVQAGRLRPEGTFYVYASRMLITEVFVDGAGPLGLHFDFGGDSGLPVMFYGRPWKRRRVATRIKPLLERASDVTAALGRHFAGVDFQPAGHGGYPAWRTTGVPDGHPAPRTPEWYAELADLALRSVAGALPFVAAPG